MWPVDCLPQASEDAAGYSPTPIELLLSRPNEEYFGFEGHVENTLTSLLRKAIVARAGDVVHPSLHSLYLNWAILQS